MVYGLDGETSNTDKLFNLVCLYGNVARVRERCDRLGGRSDLIWLSCPFSFSPSLCEDKIFENEGGHGDGSDGRRRGRGALCTTLKQYTNREHGQITNCVSIPPCASSTRFSIPISFPVFQNRTFCRRWRTHSVFQIIRQASKNTPDRRTIDSCRRPRRARIAFNHRARYVPPIASTDAKSNHPTIALIPIASIAFDRFYTFSIRRQV